jgi:MoxR-like ATPase
MMPGSPTALPHPMPTAPSPSVSAAAESLRLAIADASRGLVQREALVELVVLCAITEEHLLVIGPPGTAKSEAVRRIARRLGGRMFEYLVGRFTEPSEIFGPIDLRKLKEGIVETETAGMLPEAEIAFLDEVFLGSTAILNTLLSLLNERTFRRGHTMLRCPLRVCVGAANRLPEDEQLAAFADRFLVRSFVEPIADSGLEELLASGWSLGGADPAEAAAQEATASIAQLDLLGQAARRLDLSPLRSTLAHAIRLLRGAGIELSDRRIVRSQRLIAGAAALAGRTAASAADLWPLIFALPTQQAQLLGRDVLRELLAASESKALLAAAAESSLGPRARAARIAREGALALAEPLPAEPAKLGAWRLRLESVARELDATFPRDQLPDELAPLRARIIETLGAAQPS